MQTEIIFQIPSTISKIITLSNRSARLYVDTQENLSDEQFAKLMALHEKLCWATFLSAERQIKPEDIASLPEIEHEEVYKTPSQRQRDILYRVWEAKGKKGNFEEFYIIMMDKIAVGLKEKYLN